MLSGKCGIVPERGNHAGLASAEIDATRTTSPTRVIAYQGQNQGAPKTQYRSQAAAIQHTRCAIVCRLFFAFQHNQQYVPRKTRILRV